MPFFKDFLSLLLGYPFLKLLSNVIQQTNLVMVLYGVHQLKLLYFSVVYEHLLFPGGLCLNDWKPTGYMIS